MKLPPRKFSAPMTGGKLRDIDRKAIASYLAKHFADGELVDVTIAPHEVEHTDPQRHYYFGVVVPYAQQGMIEQGDRASKDDAHAWMMWHLAPDERQTVKYGQHEHVMRASFKKFSKARVAEHIDHCIQWIAEEFSLAVPEPSTYLRDMRR